MQSLPSPAELRLQLKSLDQRQQKIVAGMFSLMVQNPQRVREREWISEQFTQVTLLAGGFARTSEAHDGLAEVQRYLQVNLNKLLNHSFTLFAQVAAEMAEREANSLEAALEHGMTYF